ncbi:cation:H+ antiporter [Georgenia soli]|uniref:Cation:H+ antiporter n=1 Tax=Georgenia soli TaxID=638953 RepID=A0A2A9F3A9_9MICO|nr:cation:H+ antiporter [Georgenia soli]
MQGDRESWGCRRHRICTDEPGNICLLAPDWWRGDEQLLVECVSPFACPSDTAVLSPVHATDLYLTAVGALLTLVYVTGLVFRPARRVARGRRLLTVLVL